MAREECQEHAIVSSSVA
jgi:hypothetical protein